MIGYYIINKPCNTGDISSLKVKYLDRNRTYYFRIICKSKSYSVNANGAKKLRQRLIYLKTLNWVYCYICKLFQRMARNLQVASMIGKNVTRVLEEVVPHMKALLVFKRRLLIAKRIDSTCQKQLNSFGRKLLAFGIEKNH